MRKADPCKHEGANVLLVEGKNDCHVVMALCGARNFPEVFGIYECGNDAQILNRLDALVIASTPPNIIGVILDADKPDPSGRWQNIMGKVGHHGFVFPNDPDPRGTVIEARANLPKLGIWLMPDNRSIGMPEDFCLEMIQPAAKRDTAAKCVQIARDEGAATFKDAHFPKAIVHTYLAWQDEPGRPIGQAITAQTLKADASTADAFVDWLRRLFGPIAS